jgi:aryl-alcohol dehydrogenase-like predicted oxidoreductase
LALEELQRTGKVRYYGVAADSVEVGLAALRHPGVASVQFTLSLLEQGGKAELFPRALESGAGGIARECLANGLLVKPQDEVDLEKYCSSPEQVRERTQQLAELRRAADQNGRSLLRSALDFPRSVQGVSVTLLGARTLDQLNGLLAAASA